MVVTICEITSVYVYIVIFSIRKHLPYQPNALEHAGLWVFATGARLGGSFLALVADVVAAYQGHRTARSSLALRLTNFASITATALC